MFGRATIRLGIGPHSSVVIITFYRNTKVELYWVLLSTNFVVVGSRPSNYYFRSVCLSVCLFVCLSVCAEFFSAVFDPICIKLVHMLYVRV